MKSISAEKHSSVVSLLNGGYSHHQIQLKLVWGRVLLVGSVRRWRGIKRIILVIILPSSSCDKRSIICQISIGKLDKAVQATQFINSTISTPVTPQTVRNVLKEAGFRSATKKVCMLKGSHCQQHLKFV